MIFADKNSTVRTGNRNWNQYCYFHFRALFPVAFNIKNCCLCALYLCMLYVNTYLDFNKINLAISENEIRGEKDHDSICTENIIIFLLVSHRVSKHIGGTQL